MQCHGLEHHRAPRADPSLLVKLPQGAAGRSQASRPGSMRLVNALLEVAIHARSLGLTKPAELRVLNGSAPAQPRAKAGPVAMRRGFSLQSGPYVPPLLYDRDVRGEAPQACSIS